MANTTMETFLQGNAVSNNCMSCHQYASIAVPGNVVRGTRGGLALRTVVPGLVPGRGPRHLARPRGGGPAPYASSYSFLFLALTSR